MYTTAKIVALWFWLGACACSSFGQRLPALPPTIAAPTDDFSKPPEVPRHLAQVEYTAEKLKVLANNSSLNQILSEISTKIGMKITGAIPEERVFGVYGPGDPATVLAHLLAGSDSNFLLRENARHLPRELILTPRTGGPSPPAPATHSSDSSDQEDDSQDLPPQLMPHVSNSQPQSQPPAPKPRAFPALAPTNQGTPQPGTTTEQSPNGVKTPQQIYDQLMQLQQKNAPAAPK